MDIRPVESCPLVWWVQMWDVLVPTAVSLWDAEWVNRWPPHVWSPTWSMEEEVWWCAGALLVTLSVIYLEFKTPAWQPQHSATIRHPIWFALSGTIICFSTGQWPNIPPGSVRAIWPRRRVMECCIRWPDLHNHPTSTQFRWFGMSWTAEWRKSSQQLLSICRNSFKTVGKSFPMKLVERMPRVCKLSSRQTVATLRNLKSILI